VRVRSSFVSASPLPSHTLTHPSDVSTIWTRFKFIIEYGVREISNHLYRISLEEINTIFTELDQLFPNEKGWLNATEYYTLATFYLHFYIKHCPAYITIVLSNYEQASAIYQSYLNDSEFNCAVDYDLGITFCTSSLQTIIIKDKRMELYDIL
jgi:hypothetical protein